jgi:hypothetical protein
VEVAGHDDHGAEANVPVVGAAGAAPEREARDGGGAGQVVAQREVVDVSEQAHAVKVAELLELRAGHALAIRVVDQRRAVSGASVVEPRIGLLGRHATRGRDQPGHGDAGAETADAHHDRRTTRARPGFVA